MAYENPSVADFKEYFSRDFPYGVDVNTSVTDSDIAKAFQQTNMSINQALFCSQSDYTVCYLLLSAHYLVLNLRASSQGVNGQFSFLEQSKSVGGVSQAFAIPERVQNNPLWAVYFKTNYGAEYMALIYPKLLGQVFVARGSTRP